MSSAQENWDLLRKTITEDIARYKAKSTRFGDGWDVRAHHFTLVLDTMDVYEFGLEYWRAKIEADPEFVPLPEATMGAGQVASDDAESLVFADEAS